MEHSETTISEHGIGVGYDREKWVQIPMHVSNKSSELEWAATESLNVAERLKFDNDQRRNFERYLLRLVRFKDLSALRFVLTNDVKQSENTKDGFIIVSVLFDINYNRTLLSDIVSNTEHDIYLNEFSTKSLGQGLKVMRKSTKRRIFREDDTLALMQYGFSDDDIIVAVQAIHADREFLELHSADIDDLVRSIVKTS